MKKNIIYIILLIAVLAAGAVFFIIRAKEKTKETHEIARADQESDIDYYHCGMHPWIKSNKPGKCLICGMDLSPVYKNDAKAEKGVVYIDPVMVQDIGVTTAPVQRRTLNHTIRTSGIVDYDETKESEITLKFSGYIQKLYADYTGKVIQKGQPLFEIYSPELVAAQQEYLQALKYKKNLSGNPENAVKTGAGDLLQSARKKLLLWDISEKQIKKLEQSGETSNNLTIYSPYSGTIVEKDIAEGMAVQAGMTLYKLASVSDMWVYADVFANELGWVKPGATALMQLPYDPGKTVKGTVSYIYPFLQDQTRTAKVRIAFNNRGGDLKKDMYVSLKILSAASVNALTVPEQAIIHSGKRDIAVLAMGNGKFKPVDVKLGALDNHYYEVLSGLDEGDTIVTSSQFLIVSESNLESGLSDMQSMPGMDMGNSKKKDTNKEKQDMKGMKMDKN